ncbi:MAG: dTMP kinase [Acholeplasmataceae bacterium]|nr:dTMP kinase [Acholeplasmataceae bacterium]
MSVFISFEGGEGSGKTSVIDLLYRDLLDKGFDVLRTREPGGSKISEEIRNIILNINNVEMDYRTEALLYAASRRQHLVEVIIPALKSGKIVLCDRYLDASLAYQGHARGLGIDEIYKINQYATDGILPELTFFIDVKPETGLSRIKDSGRVMDRLDLERNSFHHLVREGYLSVAAMFPKRIHIIDGNRDLEIIHQEIKEQILKIL